MEGRIAVTFEEAGEDHTRSDRIDPDAAPAELHGQRLGDLDDGALGRGETCWAMPTTPALSGRGADGRAEALAPTFARIDPQGALSLGAVAAALEAEGVSTVTGKGHWTAAGVARVRERLGR